MCMETMGWIRLVKYGWRWFYISKSGLGECCCIFEISCIKPFMTPEGATQNLIWKVNSWAVRRATCPYTTPTWTPLCSSSLHSGCTASCIGTECWHWMYCISCGNMDLIPRDVGLAWQLGLTKWHMNNNFLKSFRVLSLSIFWSWPFDIPHR